MMRKILLVFGFLLLMTNVASAQDVLPLDQLAIGTISAANPTPSYSFTASSGQTLQIEVDAVTTGLVPQFTVSNNAGGQDIPNPNAQSDFKATLSFAQGGEYFVRVSSANGIGGQFVIRISDANVSPSQPQQPQQPSLQIGQSVNGTLNNGQTANYAITGSTSALVLMVQGNVNAALQNAAGETAGTIGSMAGLNGGAFYLSPGVDTYQLQLSNDTIVPLAYTVSLNPWNGQPLSGGAPIPAVPTAIIGTLAPTVVPLPVLPSTGACMLATAQNVFVNVRRAPGTDAEIVAYINPQQTYSVIGRNADTSWYQINYRSGSGWVAAYVTRHGGDCSNLPVTYTPPSPMPMPTATSSARIAGDNEWTNAIIPFEKGFEVGQGGAISYPNGDRQDTITYDISRVTYPIPPNVQFRYRICCSGDSQYARVQFTDGSTAACTPDGTNYSEYFTDFSALNGGFTIAMTGGDNAYVEWSVTFSWYIP